MNVAIVTTASDKTPWASIVLPGRQRYATRHGYATVCLSCDYHTAHAESLRVIRHMLERYSLVWGLGADCLVTNHTLQIENLSCLGPHMSICEEGIGSHALVNGDSTIWRATDGSRHLLDALLEAEAEWRQMPFTIQEWLMVNRDKLGDLMTIMPIGSANSVHYGGINHWRPGHLIYHPCGAPPHERCAMLTQMLPQIVE